MYKILIFILAFFVFNNGYSQDDFIKNDTIYLKGKNVGYIEKFKSDKLNGENTNYCTLLITQPINDIETSLIEKLIGNGDVSYVFEYKFDFSNADKIKLAGYYLIESGICKNTSLTLALLGAVGGSAVIYFINPLLGIGVSSVCGLISLVQNYQGNNYLKKAGELMMK
jgi:hypothetical protein